MEYHSWHHLSLIMIDPVFTTTGEQGETGRDAFKEIVIIPFRGARESGFEASRSPALSPSSRASAFAKYFRRAAACLLQFFEIRGENK
jgi:hypothetical protein